MKRRNKINSRKFGTKGELTEQLALVLKALWACKNETDYSTSFKAVVDRYGTQFRSSTQHDAQEFLFWLLDKVHEDLNTASKRKYKPIKVRIRNRYYIHIKCYAVKLRLLNRNHYNERKNHPKSWKILTKSISTNLCWFRVLLSIYTAIIQIEWLIKSIER